MNDNISHFLRKKKFEERNSEIQTWIPTKPEEIILLCSGEEQKMSNLIDSGFGYNYKWFSGMNQLVFQKNAIFKWKTWQIPFIPNTNDPASSEFSALYSPFIKIVVWPSELFDWESISFILSVLTQCLITIVEPCMLESVRSTKLISDRIGLFCLNLFCFFFLLCSVYSIFDHLNSGLTFPDDLETIYFLTPLDILA